MKTEALKLTEIITDAETQTRCHTTDDVVSDYAERWIEGDKFPPVIVFHDGASYYLADGFHRYLAAQRNGFKDILAEVHKGTVKDALKYALGANRANGLRRTNADKRRCVWLALENFGSTSDRQIAEMCGVSGMMVADVRREQDQLQESCSSPAKRTGKDGKARKMPKGKSEPAEPKAEPADTWDDSPRVQSADERSAWELNKTPTPAEHAPEDNDSDNLFHLKRYWKKANKKDRATFLSWANEN